MDLSTTYAGLELAHPFIAGASPLADTLDSARQAEEGGAAAIVMRSLFEEQIDAEALATHHATEPHGHSFGEATSYLPDPDEFAIGADEYIDRLGLLTRSLGIPVFASLNGTTAGGWLAHARMMEQAGAAAIELNVFEVASDVHETSAAVEQRLVEMVGQVRAGVSIPVTVKLSPFFASLPNVAMKFIEAGANGLVLFNRFFEPDIDIEELEIRPHMTLSSSSELALRLRWLAILSPLKGASLAVTGGVHTVTDAVKALMCGASAVQMVSALLMRGPQRLRAMTGELTAWLTEHEYGGLGDLQGSMNVARCPDPGAYLRGNYMRMLQTWTPV